MAGQPPKPRQGQQNSSGDPIADCLRAVGLRTTLSHKSPLFVAQGAKDPRVSINESNQIVNALRARGGTVESMIKENEGHGSHNEENRSEFYRAMETFRGQHLWA